MLLRSLNRPRLRNQLYQIIGYNLIKGVSNLNPLPELLAHPLFCSPPQPAILSLPSQTSAIINPHSHHLIMIYVAQYPLYPSSSQQLINQEEDSGKVEISRFLKNFKEKLQFQVRQAGNEWVESEKTYIEIGRVLGECKRGCCGLRCTAVQFEYLMNNEQDPCLIRSLKGHKESIMTVDLHPTSKYVASAGMDNVILLWDLSKQGQPHKLLGHKNQINNLKFSPNGSLLVSASSDQSIKFWEVDFDTTAKEVTLIKAHNARIRGVGFSCDGLLLASCGDDKLVKIWSTVDRRLQYTLKQHNNWIRYCQFSPTATNVVSCDDKIIHIWDLNTKKSIQSYQEHTGVIHQVKFHSLGNCIASCSHDKKIKLYDLRSQHVIQIYEGHDGPVKSIDFHPHAPYLISSSEDGTTKIWNSQKGRLEYTLESHSNTTKFSRQGDYFISGGSDKVINIWKTGFFDSLKEKINPSDNTVNANRKKVVPNTEKEEIKGLEEPSQTSNRIDLNELSSEREPEQVLYNHQKENFQLLGGASKPAQKMDLKGLLPAKFLAKLQRISNQIDFITKTTQILETRVLNNGEQLQRIIQLAEM